MKSINDQGDYIVWMDGIAFLITNASSAYGQTILSKMAHKTARDTCVKTILEECFLLNQSASGIMIVREENGQTYCDPFVYVRDVDSLYYETACSSGSAAIGLAESVKKNRLRFNLDIIQPSGLALKVTINRGKESFWSAFVSGPIQVLSDGPMLIPNKAQIVSRLQR